MTEKKNIFQKLWDGTCYFFNPNNSPVYNDIKKEIQAYPNGALKKAIKEKIILDLEIMTFFAVYFGTVLTLAKVMDIPKEKDKECIPKHEVNLKEFNAQDLVLEHYFYPCEEKEEPFTLEKKKFPGVDYFKIPLNQKVME